MFNKSLFSCVEFNKDPYPLEAYYSDQQNQSLTSYFKQTSMYLDYFLRSYHETTPKETRGNRNTYIMPPMYYIFLLGWWYPIDVPLRQDTGPKYFSC